MRADSWSVSVWGVRSLGLVPSAALAEPWINQRVLELAISPPHRRADGRLGASVHILARQVPDVRTVGTSIDDVDHHHEAGAAVWTFAQ